MNMKAAMHYGVDDIRVEEIAKPECPKGGLLVKMVYVTTCGTDVKKFKRGGYVMDSNPDAAKVFGHEGSGIVCEVDGEETGFQVGDRIVFHDAHACGLCDNCKRGMSNICTNMAHVGGTWCEYVAIPKEILGRGAVFHVPDDMPLELAPCVEPMASAMHCAENTHVRLGDYVVVNGAGPLGLGIIKFVSSMGGRVIACDKSTYRLERAKKMGAEWTIEVTSDMTADDQIAAVRALTPDGRGCDVCIEAVGLPATWELTIPMARKGGLILEFAGCKGGTTITVDTALLHYSELTIKGLYHATQRQIQMSFESLCRGLLPRDIMITGHYTLDNCVQALNDHYNQIGVKNLIQISEETL